MAEKKVGRKSLYESHIKPYLEKIDLWLNDGADEKQVAENLGIAYSTWNVYKTKYPELKDLCDKPRASLVDGLKGALVKKALGFTHTNTRALKVKDIIYEDGKKVRETEKVIYYDDDTYFPPDTTAIFGALKIYDKDKLDYDIQAQSIDLKKQELEFKKEQAKKDW